MIRRAIAAPFVGLLLCLGTSSVRRLAVRPWLLGGVTYLVLLALAVPAHSVLLQAMIGTGQGVWHGLIWFVSWIFLAVVLFALAAVGSLIATLIFGAIWLSDIADAVLRSGGVALPPRSEDAVSVVRDSLRAGAGEAAKLLWIAPLAAVLLVAGFFPVLMPLSVIAGAWLLGYQVLDVVWERQSAGVLARLARAFREFVLVACFGGASAVFVAIPVFGLFCVPVLVAGGAWFEARRAQPELPTAPKSGA